MKEYHLDGEVTRYLSLSVNFDFVEGVKLEYAPRTNGERRNGCSRSCVHLPFTKYFHLVSVFQSLLTTFLFALRNAHDFESFDAKTCRRWENISPMTSFSYMPKSSVAIDSKKEQMLEFSRTSNCTERTRRSRGSPKTLAQTLVARPRRGK